MPKRQALVAAGLGFFTVFALAFTGPVAQADQEPSSPNKASSPGTDLADYPKLPVRAVDPSLWGKPDAGNEVTSTQLNADGSGTTTIYSPVAGESAQVLYGLLKSAGVKGVINPEAQAKEANSSTISPTAVGSLTSCHYGTAQTFQCGTDNNLNHQVRWADDCCGHPQVYFVDHTGANWPVDTATYVWNQAQGVDSIYAYGSCPGYSGTHCVNVTDRNAGCSGWQGLTTLHWNQYYQILSTSTVQLNAYNGTCTVGSTTYYYDKNAAGYRQDACHEMGHALGLGHNTSTGSCLYGTIINNNSALKPNGNDFTLVQQLYDDGD